MIKGYRNYTTFLMITVLSLSYSILFELIVVLDMESIKIFLYSCEEFSILPLTCLSVLKNN